MFSEQKWNILRSLSSERLSPLQLADKLNTTIANISQQLRLLQAANLVKKEKIKNRDKGKPRTLFSLTEDCAYLIPTMQNFTDKKLLRVTEHHKTILKIWFLENQELHLFIEKLYWKIEPHLKEVQAIGFNEPSKELFIFADKPSEIEKLIGKNRIVAVKVVASEKISSGNGFSIIYNRDNHNHDNHSNSNNSNKQGILAGRKTS